jgi:hypothetical protein
MANNTILFNPSFTAKDSLAECFQIFTDPSKISDEPVKRYQYSEANVRHPPIKVYTDRACFNNGKLNAKCGSGVWFGPNDERNHTIKVPGSNHSNQISKIVAINKAVNMTLPFQPLIIMTDSKYMINSLKMHLGTWKDKGWIRIKNGPYFRKAAHLLR